ncbi:histidine kinase [Thermocladium modestius]|uniref:Histidine kinase n=1 Tax=Thermocladium modestius TaxID=62609 RepID=A0A830GW27_9CREN|nr:CBS domain-containing protein [Thermocladium modestius]GGP21942.1 histidine kinase [Thermocladium modestius]
MESLPQTFIKILESLVELHNNYKRPIKSKEIATRLGMNEGTVRNIMISLRAMGFIDSKTGPYGGFTPSQKAMELLRSPSMMAGISDIAPIAVEKQGTVMYATNIELLDMLNPFITKAIIKVMGNLRQLPLGSLVKIGPTTNARIVIEGQVMEKNDQMREIVISIRRFISIPKVKVKEISSKQVLVISKGEPLRAAARLFSERKIRALPVVDDGGRLVGLITSTDVARAYVEGNLDATVEEYMRSEVPFIRDDDDVYDAINLMISKNIGRLVVIDDKNNPVGIITRTDVLGLLVD